MWQSVRQYRKVTWTTSQTTILVPETRRPPPDPSGANGQMNVSKSGHECRRVTSAWVPRHLSLNHHRQSRDPCRAGKVQEAPTGTPLQLLKRAHNAVLKEQVKKRFVTDPTSAVITRRSVVASAAACSQHE